jgi:Ty3 transposon capsid-like protein
MQTEEGSQQLLQRLAALEASQQQLYAQANAARQNSATTYLAVKPPKPGPYDGGKGVILWLSKLEQFFEVTNLQTEAQKIQYAGLLLNGSAGTWWTALREAAQLGTMQFPATWSAFRTALCDRFQPVSEKRLARQLMRRLTQDKMSISAYINTFQDLAMKLPDMDEETKMDSFCFGLRQNYRSFVRQQDPHTLADAVKDALRFHATMLEDAAADKVLGNRWRRTFSPRGASDAATPMELGAAKTEPARQQGRPVRNSMKCFACKRAGHLVKDCKDQTAKQKWMDAKKNRDAGSSGN